MGNSFWEGAEEVPTPEKTSLGAIVAAGREALEMGGPQGLTMQSVATRVGVRAPSLYKHVRDRAALLAAVADDALDELVARLEATDGSLEEGIREYRRFAQGHPEAFRLTQSGVASQEALARAVAPILRASGELVGERDQLEAARLVTAWAVGFIGMELGGAFRLGGDVDRSFEYGLAAIRSALAAGGPGDGLSG
ncbi:TetR/AcrR family transcriptional regulator [Streptomyces sp. NPDC049040]|uniref:TetR/AcrR family transcriptional regulator n=1 Tax=Streptomyces sp. NPDC049040 TaxID=3365593 RepID=UPI003713137D